MTSGRIEIENVIEKGRILLSEHPEFMNMTLQDVINELDDGTQQMMHDQWGVVACIVVKSIGNFDIHSLVEQLSEVDSGVLTYEYSGYLLQKEYHVNLEDLILEADRQGKFDKIVSYVSSNLVYEEKLYEDNICKIVNMLEGHIESDFYHSFLIGYVNHITNMGAQYVTEIALENSIGQVQHDIMYAMRWDWYKKDVSEASAVIGKMGQHDSIWCKKAAIAFWESSLYYDIMIFQKYFTLMENIILGNEELWLMTIPIFAKYIMVADSHIERKATLIYSQVVKYLENISNGSVEEKCKFIEAIQYQNELPETLNTIFHTIIKQSFEKNENLLAALNTFLYGEIAKNKVQTVLQIMLDVFISNKYLEDYNVFFNTMNLVIHELLKHKQEVTVDALKYMLSGDVGQLFFGLGLLMTAGDIQELSKETSIHFTDEQLIRLMKGILYFGIDGTKICHIAYQLLKLSEGTNNAYIDFCVEEVYGNYSATMVDIGKQYITSEIKKQGYLAERIVEREKQFSKEQAFSYEIKDLQPSMEHQYIYQKAQMESNRQIHKQAEEKSVFAQFFPSRTLKYGVRMAHIVIGRKNEMFYRVSPFVQHKRTIELPASYVKDPVSFYLKGEIYLEEVSQDEINYKGLSASIERER